MKYKYPKVINTLSYKTISVDKVEVIDFYSKNMFIFGREVVNFVSKLDGRTNPYSIHSVLSRLERDQLIDFLQKHDLIVWSNNLRVSFGTVLKTLCAPKATQRLKMISQIANKILLLIWIPVLIGGMIAFANQDVVLNMEGMLLGFAVGVVCGILGHEVGHAIAGIAYGANVFELGVLVMFCVIPGGYVIMDHGNVERRMHRVQILSAGVEVNFLLAGIFFMACAVFPQYGAGFFGAAFYNAFMGLINLLGIEGMDGGKIMSELLGGDDFFEWTRNVAMDGDARRAVLRSDPDGYAIVTMCYLMCVLQMVFPVFIITNVLEVIAWIAL